MVEGNTGRRAKVSAVWKRRGHRPHHARKEVVGTWETRMRSAAGHRRGPMAREDHSRGLWRVRVADRGVVP